MTGQAAASGAPLPIRHSPAFTLLELLTVIFIMGILVALAVPALKTFGKSNTQVSAARQLLDDVGRARQLAISGHTTVYMVFVPAIWSMQGSLPTAASLLDKQYTGYNFLSLRSVGDQPGRNSVNYLAEWKSLPDGAFIATNKFAGTNTITDASINVTYPINQFNYASLFPFPAATNVAGVSLPYIAFNYLGQLTVDGVNQSPQDEYIPLAQGTVFYAANPTTKVLQWAAPDASENPPGNSTNSSFTIVHIDSLTGRADLKQQSVQ